MNPILEKLFENTIYKVKYTDITPTSLVYNGATIYFADLWNFVENNSNDEYFSKKYRIEDEETQQILVADIDMSLLGVFFKKPKDTGKIRSIAIYPTVYDFIDSNRDNAEYCKAYFVAFHKLIEKYLSNVSNKYWI